MKYFFILGNNPTLSLAELSAVLELDENNIIFFENILIAEIKKEFDGARLIKRLGGTIKIGVIDFETANGKDAIVREIMKVMDEKEKDDQGKFYFGISAYSHKAMNIRPIGMEIKNNLRAKNISCRFVVSREAALSSVVVEQNKLLKNGMEIVLINDKGKIYGGHTLAVQPFKDLSFRDYGRPARDDRSGMLPPKLAQIMINLSGMMPCVETHCNASLLDPFCGSGTILTEAALMGFQNLTGTDISDKAITDTRKNMEWIKINFQFPISNFQTISNFKLYNIKTEELSQKISPDSIDTIITEPYLGPQRGRFDFQKVKKELEELYSKSLKEFYKILKPNGRVVMVWPVFFLKASSFKLQADLNGFKIINPIPKDLRENKNLRLTDRNTIVYGRDGQKVWREIVVLEKS
jgi:tRNA G10  N-methylase Trm11